MTGWKCWPGSPKRASSSPPRSSRRYCRPGQRASQGEGLGNKFLSHIREVDAIVPGRPVLRGHGYSSRGRGHRPGPRHRDHPDRVGDDRPGSGAERRERVAKDAKRGDKVAIAESEVLAKLEPHLNLGKPAITLELSSEDKAVAKGFFLMTTSRRYSRPTCGKKTWLPLTATRMWPRCGSMPARTLPARRGDQRQIESELIDLSPAEAREFLQGLGVQESGVGALIRSTYSLLGLRTYFTAGEKETAPGPSTRGHGSQRRG